MIDEETYKTEKEAREARTEAGGILATVGRFGRRAGTRHAGALFLPRG